MKGKTFWTTEESVRDSANGLKTAAVHRYLQKNPSQNRSKQAALIYIAGA